MRSWSILLTLLLVLAGCEAENPSLQIRPVRTVVVDPKPILDNRQAVGEVKPRYESELSFRVAGQLVSRRVDVGVEVKQGDILARLDVQDYQNKLRSAEADVAAAEAALVEAQSTERRLGQLLKNGWTPKANYDTALHNFQAAEAKLASAKASLAEPDRRGLGDHSRRRKLRGFRPDYTPGEPVSGVVTHEFGHAIGLAHTQTNGFYAAQPGRPGLGHSRWPGAGGTGPMRQSGAIPEGEPDRDDVSDDRPAPVDPELQQPADGDRSRRCG